MKRVFHENARRFTFVLFGDVEFYYVIKHLFILLNPQAMVVSPRHPSGDDNEGFHYHVYVQYNHLVSVESVRRCVDIFPISKVFPVKNTKFLIRSFCHYDGPEKGILFDPSELRVYGDIDIKKYFK